MNHQERIQRHFGRLHEGGARRIVGRAFVGIVVASFFALVFGLVVKALWNWIMPAVFGLTVITYWQAFGIIILAKILFSGIHPHPSHDRFGPPFARQRRSYDRWWREEGQQAFDGWLAAQTGTERPEKDA